MTHLNWDIFVLRIYTRSKILIILGLENKISNKGIINPTMKIHEESWNTHTHTHKDILKNIFLVTIDFHWMDKKKKKNTPIRYFFFLFFLFCMFNRSNKVNISNYTISSTTQFHLLTLNWSKNNKCLFLLPILSISFILPTY